MYSFPLLAYFLHIGLIFRHAFLTNFTAFIFLFSQYRLHHLKLVFLHFHFPQLILIFLNFVAQLILS